ncbi:DUF3168 domain-containing protein [Aureimonas psammosilenae]|uniref:DUF3168 domain-containing protein n=1 Tax=Aureimonas psammosilenae TaxID=2495496 RepID=UPI0012609C30|nr:DUF3168 domain-containing protein [Aureimonas psammosilenae]
MIEPTLALQDAIGARLAGTKAVTDLVPAASIVDGPRTPAAFPSIIIGEGQTAYEEVTYERKHVRVFMDLHIWTDEESLAGAKIITGAVLGALDQPLTPEGIALVDLYIAGTRFLRDPSRNYGRAIVSVEAIVGRLA